MKTEKGKALYKTNLWISLSHLKRNGKSKVKRKVTTMVAEHFLKP